MTSSQTVRRHRAGQNPNGRPAQELIDAYRADGVPARGPVPA